MMYSLCSAQDYLIIMSSQLLILRETMVYEDESELIYSVAKAANIRKYETTECQIRCITDSSVIISDSD